MKSIFFYYNHSFVNTFGTSRCQYKFTWKYPDCKWIYRRNLQNSSNIYYPWKRGFLRWQDVTLDAKFPGLHTLKVFMIDPEVVLERIIINPNDRYPCYLGAPAVVEGIGG
ncbi:hypothetical protein [Chryseobacterium wanjuense]